MIKMGLFLLAVLAAFVVYVASKPPEYLIFREVSVQTSPERVFPLINNSREMGRWMPWSETDPQMKMSYSGPEAGVGSKASWESLGKMGVGSSTISESIANRLVKFDLQYLKPFEMRQAAEISIQPLGARSVVRWSVSGHNNFIGRSLCVFMNMDKMVGGSFEKGLAKLKAIAES